MLLASADSTQIKIAAISATSAVVAAIIAALAATFQRNRPIENILPPPVDHDGLEIELRRRAEVAENRVNQLERLLIDNGFNPFTGQRVGQ